MRNLIKRSLAIAALTAAMAGQSVLANEQLPKDRAGGDMFLDAVFARPIGLIAIVAGSTAFVVALPFTLISGSVNSSADELVKKPIDYTFKRPLGQLQEPE
jgi:ribose/xylose/arabinose/galactoside ABC-type transport system permease subunit